MNSSNHDYKQSVNQNLNYYTKPLDDLRIIQDNQNVKRINENTAQDDPNHPVNWLDQLCNTQSILTLEHAQACLKFREYMQNELKIANANLQNTQNQATVSDPATNYIQDQSQNSQMNNQQQNNLMPYIFDHQHHQYSLGYYLCYGAAIIVGFKVMRRIIFGKQCQSKWYHLHNHHSDYIKNGYSPKKRSSFYKHRYK